MTPLKLRDEQHQCSKIGFWLGVMMMKKKSGMKKKKQVKAYTIFAKKAERYAG